MITFLRRSRGHGLHAADALTERPRRPEAAAPEVAHEEPRGLRRPEVLAALRAQAEAEAAAARIPAGPTPPANLAPLWLGETFVDMFPHAPRRFVPPGAVHPEPPRIRRVPPELPRRAFTPAAVAQDWLGRITYPGYDGTPETYAALMRRISAVTGTASSRERPGAWQRHAIEAGTEAAA